MDMNTGLNMAAVIASNSVYVGGNWGFVSNTNDDYERIYACMVNNENSKFNIVEVSNGLLVFCDINYLYKAVSQVEVLTPEVTNKVKTRASSELGKLQQFLMSIKNKNCKYGTKVDDFIEYDIALYCCNSMNKIRLNGKEYPAFSLTVMEACREILKLGNVIPIYVNMGDSFKNIKDMKSNDDVDKIMSALEISNTLTGAFLTIRVKA